ncbi:hypothetical protein [Actinoplanes sp. TBRC 11911]|uniref:hypothetical protein n=1 Tax=Actinoplanes sp. TBRC 11911 TaxID=2729386 RepID=UPI001B7D5C08|nr:hypothetical protein [Actinoplanes sp. TBRC 11911]
MSYDQPPTGGYGYPPPPGQPGYPPRDGQGYPQPGNQGFPPPGNQGYPPPGGGYPPPPGDYPPGPGPGYPPGQDYPPGPGYSPEAPPQQRFSGLAIAGFVLSFLGGVLGFVLSLIAIFQTGKGKKRGRGLAVSGVVISVVVAGLGIALVVSASNSSSLDPGCAPGQAAILKVTGNQSLDSVQSAITDLNTAAAKAKSDKVRTAMTTLANDAGKIVADAQKGQAPSAAALQKVNTDGLAIETLCPIGS